MKVSKIFCLIHVFLFVFVVRSQITIGSSSSAVDGALLQIKNREGEGANSDKGLILPRVSLKSLSGDLATSMGAVSNSYQEDHTGLVVYNITSNPKCPEINPGVYFWDGQMWISMMSSTQDKAGFVDNGDGTGLLKDYEGNTYTTKKFGSLWWMTQNLYSIKNSNGSFLYDCTGEPLSLNPGYDNGGVNAVWINKEIPLGYVKPFINHGQVVAENQKTYKEIASEYGLLYNMKQAKVACPKGWRLPTLEDWNNLEISVGASAGHKLKAYNGTQYKSVDLSDYKWGSLGVVENGFNVVPSGYNGSNGTTWNFGFSASFKIMDKEDGIIFFRYSGANIERLSTISTKYQSVRCVKD